MQAPVFPHKGNSYMRMPAQEVIRMARNSIIEINATRAEMKRKVSKLIDVEKKGLGSFVQSLLAPHARKIARERAFYMAGNLGWGDVAVCELLEKMAERMINDVSIPDDQKFLHITVADYSALV